MNIGIVLGVTFLAGLLVASFGAFKDTLWESFSLRKFFRTPTITVIAGMILYQLAFKPDSLGDLLFFSLSSVGLERLLVDSLYKGIRRKMPSKFLRPQRDTRWMHDRFSQLTLSWRTRRAKRMVE